MTPHIRLRRAALAAAALLGLALLVAGCSTAHDGGGMSHGSSSTTSAQGGVSFNDADVSFAQAMIPHHRQAVEMASMAETRAADLELKKLAAQIKAAQDPEITTMTGWLTAWSKPLAAPSAHDMGGTNHSNMPGMMSEADMTALKSATGKAFDKQFAQMMIDHHLGAIQMADDEKAHGANGDAKALAGQIITGQQAEVDTLKAMLARLG